MAPAHTREQTVIRWLVRSALAVAAAALLAYPLDWAVWSARVAAGGGMDSVAIDHYTVAQLKGNKQELYIDGTTQVACSRSLFPEAGSGACWWVRRHRQVVDTY